jgi:hypothetical protein
MVTRSQAIVEWYYCWHYRIVERHLWPWSRALARRWHAVIARLPRRGGVDEPEGLQKENRPMEDTSMMPMASVALGRLLLTKLDQESVKAIEAAVAEKIRDEVEEQVRTEAEAQAREQLEEQRLKWQDQLAAEKEDVWSEVEDRVEAGIEKERARLRDEFLDDIRELKRDGATLTAERDTAEGALLHVLEQLLPRDKFIYLRNAGIKRLDLTLLAPILAKRGLRIRTELTKIPRTVEVLIAPGQPRARTLFMLESTIGADEGPSATPALPAHQESPS